MTNAATGILNNFRIFKTYKLKYHIYSASGEIIEEIEIRRMNLKDKEAFENKRFDPQSDETKMIKFLLSQLTKIVPEDLDYMDNDDINGVSEVLLELIGVAEKSEKSVD
ncbi:phage tail assembly protein [Phocoenobacter skyensis]|uniref:Phage tail assembly protein n=1 Tax=Phocoenobacter skyensis TaxID=97481 RepID=A0ABT9JN21_9PAST|nr:phage tail assembly protein [Pasteurella skyensis]MDP8080247.1 phage tail assembly protein [Pasteurella skyensis]MDP8086214.1 phage tail assembly protein [Pasteurella skyensis]